MLDSSRIPPSATIVVYLTIHHSAVVHRWKTAKRSLTGWCETMPTRDGFRICNQMAKECRGVRGNFFVSRFDWYCCVATKWAQTLKSSNEKLFENDETSLKQEISLTFDFAKAHWMDSCQKVRTVGHRTAHINAGYNIIPVKKRQFISCKCIRVGDQKRWLPSPAVYGSILVRAIRYSRTFVEDPTNVCGKLEFLTTLDLF